MDEPKTEVVALRIPATQKAWLKKQAKETDRSMNYVARKLFERAIEAERGRAA